MVIDANLDPKISRQRDIAERQVALFTERYGEMMLDFACHAAFPQMLTTEFIYCVNCYTNGTNWNYLGRQLQNYSYLTCAIQPDTICMG
jgi:hypothetical protein